MAQLTPSQAAEIANGVYELKDKTVSQLASGGDSLRDQDTDPLRIDTLFATSDTNRLKGTSGANPLGLVPAFTVVTGFGYIAQGVGAFKGETLVALRGTASAYDGLTDANIGVSTGPTGTPVHMGFNTSWKSFAPEIQKYFQAHKTNRIHCVGHSLGGALATLAADYLSTHAGAKVELYTFGSPRTGGSTFAGDVTRKLGADAIHRVFHPADPVPMVPLWPFLHVPKGGDGLAIAATETDRIRPSAHSMVESYIPNMTGKSWGQLRANGTQTLTDRQIKAWIIRAGNVGVLSWGARAQELIAIALDWLLRQVATGVVIGLQAVIGGGITMLDELAYLIHRAAEISAEMSMYVKSLITIILKFIGRTAQTGASLTEKFIRWVLNIMLATMRTMVTGAVGLLR